MEPRSFKRGNLADGEGQKDLIERFNGATFIQTWKPEVRVLAEPRPNAASMEPRSFKRGNRPLRLPTVRDQ